MTGLFAGASAAEEVLQQESGKLTVLVVWEPILPSDWSRPTRPVMARIQDNRVIQFWDKDHLIAEQLSRQLRTKQPTCCRHSGTLWDLAPFIRIARLGTTPSLSMWTDLFTKLRANLQNQTSKLLQSLNATNASSLKPIR
jgi:hypothetical protein